MQETATPVECERSHPVPFESDWLSDGEALLGEAVETEESDARSNERGAREMGQSA
jgi:hypothetical protein